METLSGAQLVDCRFRQRIKCRGRDSCWRWVSLNCLVIVVVLDGGEILFDDD